MFDNIQSSTAIIVIGATILVFLLITVVAKVIREIKLNQMLDLLNAKKYDEFDKLVENKLVKVVFDPFNIDYIKLNSYMLRNDESLIDKGFKRFDEVRLNKRQKDDVEMKAFSYYLSKGNNLKATEYYNRINDSQTNKMKKEVDRLYSIYIKKESRYLEELLKEVEQIDEKYRSADELLIAAIYSNLGDKKKEKEYRDLAESHMK